MTTLESVLYPVVDEISESLAGGSSLPKSPETPLFGPAAIWDSIDLVNFILSVEERVEKIARKRIHLVSEDAFSRKRSPFRTLGTLADYVDELIRRSDCG